MGKGDQDKPIVLTARRKFLILELRKRLQSVYREVPVTLGGAAWRRALFEGIRKYDSDITPSHIQKWVDTHAWITDDSLQIPGMRRYWDIDADEATDVGRGCDSYPFRPKESRGPVPPPSQNSQLEVPESSVPAATVNSGIQIEPVPIGLQSGATSTLPVATANGIQHPSSSRTERPKAIPNSAIPIQLPPSRISSDGFPTRTFPSPPQYRYFDRITVYPPNYIRPPRVPRSTAARTARLNQAQAKVSAPPPAPVDMEHEETKEQQSMDVGSQQEQTLAKASTSGPSGSQVVGVEGQNLKELEKAQSKSVPQTFRQPTAILSTVLQTSVCPPPTPTPTPRPPTVIPSTSTIPIPQTSTVYPPIVIQSTIPQTSTAIAATIPQTSTVFPPITSSIRPPTVIPSIVPQTSTVCPSSTPTVIAVTIPISQTASSRPLPTLTPRPPAAIAATISQTSTVFPPTIRPSVTIASTTPQASTVCPPHTPMLRPATVIPSTVPQTSALFLPNASSSSLGAVWPRTPAPLAQAAPTHCQPLMPIGGQIPYNPPYGYPRSYPYQNNMQQYPYNMQHAAVYPPVPPPFAPYGPPFMPNGYGYSVPYNPYGYGYPPSYHHPYQNSPYMQQPQPQPSQNGPFEFSAFPRQNGFNLNAPVPAVPAVLGTVERKVASQNRKDSMKIKQQQISDDADEIIEIPIKRERLQEPIILTVEDEGTEETDNSGDNFGFYGS